ncbi:MAG: hypothetical protein NC923_07765 [Candidatus Omnitrophica bacterium]|nr:hypothetical protein [Candidatus Omnitrophota bacterium]
MRIIRGFGMEYLRFSLNGAWFLRGFTALGDYSYGNNYFFAVFYTLTSGGLRVQSVSDNLIRKKFEHGI